MKVTVIILVFLLVLIIVVKYLAMDRWWSVGFNEGFEAMPMLNIIPGPLPESVKNLITSTCVRVYSEKNFGGELLGCVPPGHATDPENLFILQTGKSLAVPPGYFIQVYGPYGENDSNIGHTSIADWHPDYRIMEFVVQKSDLVTINKGPPTPVQDDWMSFMVKPEEAAAADLSNLSPLNFDKTLIPTDLNVSIQY